MKIKTFKIFSSLVFALFLTASSSHAGEIWITNGSSYSTGGGSAANPVVIDTAAHFDSYMSSIPAGSHIHLMAGTFQTAAGINVQSGWTIQGDGIDRTFIQASNLTAPYQIATVIQSSITPSNVYIQDLTVDCNFQNQPMNSNLKDQAIQISGYDLHVSRVKVINFGCTQSGQEDFVITIGLGFGAFSSAATNITIDGCILTQPGTFSNGGYVNGLSIFGGCGLLNEEDTNHVTAVGPGWIVGGEIKNCKIYGINASGNAITWSGVADTKVHDNIVLDCPSMGAMYSEDSSYSDLEVANNFFDGVAYGIYFADGNPLVRLRNNLNIHDNSVSTGSAFGIMVDAGGGTTQLNGLSVQNNDVTTPVGGNYTTYGINVIGATNAVLAGNTVSSSSSYAPLIFMQAVTNMTVRNNQSLTGPNLDIYDNTTGLTQGEQETTIVYSFIPSAIGWYQLAQSGNGLTGKAVIAYENSNTGTLSDIEASFTGNAYYGADVGTITCTRDQNYGFAIDQIRVATDSSYQVYFDVHVPAVDGTPVYVKLTMDAATAIFGLQNVIDGCYAPTGLAPGRLNSSVLDLTHDGGLQMIGSLIVSNEVIVTPNGLIKSSQLDSTGLTGIATLTPSSGALMLGNGSAWTATVPHGDATISSAGTVTVTNVTSTSDAIAGYQLITSTTTLTGSTPRVIQASGTTTINLPTPVAGKEFLIQNINAAGAGSVSVNYSSSNLVAISGTYTVIAVGRSDGRWQVTHQF